MIKLREYLCDKGWGDSDPKREIATTISMAANGLPSIAIIEVSGTPTKGMAIVSMRGDDVWVFHALDNSFKRERTNSKAAKELKKHALLELQKGKP